MKELDGPKIIGCATSIQGPSYFLPDMIRITLNFQL